MLFYISGVFGSLTCKTFVHSVAIKKSEKRMCYSKPNGRYFYDTTECRKCTRISLRLEPTRITTSDEIITSINREKEENK